MRFILLLILLPLLGIGQTSIPCYKVEKETEKGIQTYNSCAYELYPTFHHADTVKAYFLIHSFLNAYYPTSAIGSIIYVYNEDFDNQYILVDIKYVVNNQVINTEENPIWMIKKIKN